MGHRSVARVALHEAEGRAARYGTVRYEGRKACLAQLIANQPSRVQRMKMEDGRCSDLVLPLQAIRDRVCEIVGDCALRFSYFEIFGGGSRRYMHASFTHP